LWPPACLLRAAAEHTTDPALSANLPRVRATLQAVEAGKIAVASEAEKPTLVDRPRDRRRYGFDAGAARALAVFDCVYRIAISRLPHLLSEVPLGQVWACH
jgi:hypothetical protein